MAAQRKAEHVDWNPSILARKPERVKINVPVKIIFLYDIVTPQAKGYLIVCENEGNYSEVAHKK